MLGELSRFRGQRNPGEFNWKRYNRFHDQLCRFTVKDGDLLQAVESTAVWSPEGLNDKLRLRFSGMLSEDGFSVEGSSLLKAMVLGERDATFRRLNEAFQTTGLFHFLCVSGLHLGILAGFIWFTSLIIGLPRRAGAMLVMAAVILYAVLVPGRAPIIRATVVVCLFCLAEISGREVKRLHTLALAALLILLWRPAELFNIGFQLSFIIVTALILLSRRLVGMILGGTMSDWVKEPDTGPRSRVKQLGQWLWL
jgi:competence protein ComEC